MATVIMDRQLAEQLRQQRAAAGSDRWDEVWEGTYMMTPLANNEHQELVGAFVDVLREALAGTGARVYPGANVSDREQDWTFNYRCPDVAVFLADTSAQDCRTHWRGGPDFAIEIASTDDMVRDKLAFYGKVRTRELLIVDRDPWQLELLRLDGVELKSVGIVDEAGGQHLDSEVLSLTFGLTVGVERPSILVRASNGKSWDI
jgi:Uma2 family endonuclease